MVGIRSAFLVAVSLSVSIAGPAGAVGKPDTVVVTAKREPASALDIAGNISQLTENELRLTSALHPYELSVRIPGTWVSRGSGQEHLTAIRSPVLTGPGSCGAFLIMEDNIPTRPAGFCNVNQLAELPIELAAGMEVIRGPANALYGSNGLHGTINVLLPEPGKAAGASLGLEAGSNDYRRVTTRWDSAPGTHAFSAGLVADRDGGYQADSGYKQYKGYLKSRHDLQSGTVSLALSGTTLDQETAGFITGFEAYKDPQLRFGNPNPEAFRDIRSLRASATWEPLPKGIWQPEYRVYFRNSDMEFLQHFLPGKPLEENGQTSAGFSTIARRTYLNDAELTLGFDAELADGYLRQNQDAPTEGSAFLMATRPAGKHYDYNVDSYHAATFVSLSWALGPQLELQLGTRAEWLIYDYDNRMLDGNSRDDGSPCVWLGNEGCLYNRPADRRDRFFNLAPNIGLLYRLDTATSVFANMTRGFRAPQATELYRLQTPQTVADIDSERLDSFETGIRHLGPRVGAEVVAYYMRKENFIFRDAQSLNVSDGKTDHLGLEVGLDWRISSSWYTGLTGSLARHRYRFDRSAAQGEIIVRGNRVDTAPATLASARVGYSYQRGVAEIEWAHTGDYYLDAANTDSYGGHDLLNLRLTFRPADAWELSLRINNLTDVVYADRADLVSIGSPSYRYFPGHPREIYAGLLWTLH